MRGRVIVATVLSAGVVSAGAASAGAQAGGDDFEDLPVEAGDADEPAAEEAARTVAPDRPHFWDRGEAFGDFELELRLFAHDPLMPDQPEQASTAFAFRPGYVFRLAPRVTTRATALVRLDEHDSARSTADIREAVAEVGLGRATLRAGIGKVFWGVTESRHLVDIINQVDYREEIDGDERHGQLMAMASYERAPFGLIDAFVTGWFQPQRFPGVTGRPGPPVPVLETALYESDLERWHPDLAARWFNRRGPLEGAVSYFYGTAREPRLTMVPVAGGFALQPEYDLIHQLGLELQWTAGNWLWKLESIGRQGQGARFVAATAGVEKTFPSLVGKTDVSLFAEYNYDGRDSGTFTFLDRDLFAAARLSLNDAGGSQITLGATVDVESRDTAAQLELSRRIADKWTATVEARLFHASDDQDPLFWFRRDDYAQAVVRYYY